MVRVSAGCRLGQPAQVGNVPNTGVITARPVPAGSRATSGYDTRVPGFIIP